jgi:hypothetical protein
MFRLPANNKNSINDRTILSPQFAGGFSFQGFGKRTLFSRDGNLLLAFQSNFGRWYSLNALSNEEFVRFDGTTSPDSAKALSPDGKFLSEYADNVIGGFQVGKVIIRNSYTGALTRTIDNPRTGFDDYFGDEDLAWSLDNSILAVGSSRYKGTVNTQILGTVHIMNANTGAVIRTITDPLGQNSSERGFGEQIALSDDGTKVAIGAHLNDSEKGIVRIYNASTGSLLLSITSPTPVNFARFGYSLAINSDLSVIAIGEPGYSSNIGRAYLFNGSTGALLQTFSAPLTTPSTAEYGEFVSLSADGSMFSSHQRVNGLADPTDATSWIYRTNSTTPLKRHDTKTSNGYYRNIFSADGSRYMIPNWGVNPILPYDSQYDGAGAVYIYGL